MKIESKKLAAALSKVISIVGRRTSVPILGCVLIQSRENTLEITATDLDCWATAKCECDGKLDLICVSGRLLHGLIQNAPEWVSISIEGNRLIIEGNGRAAVSFLAAEEFPPFPVTTNKAAGISAVDLADCIESVAWAAAPPDSHAWTCTGVYVHTTPKSMRCVASDKKKFAQSKRGIIGVDLEFLFPATHSALLCASLRGENSTVWVSDKNVICHSDSLAVSVRLIEGNCFNLDGYLGLPRGNAGQIENSEMVQATGTITMLAKDKKYCPTKGIPGKEGIRFEYKDGESDFKVTISGGSNAQEFRVNASLANEVLRNSPAGKLNTTLLVTEGKASALFFESGDITTGVALMN